MKKTFVYVGNWSFEAHPAKGKGITLYEYDEREGSLTLVETTDTEIAAGQLALDEDRGILYSNDECGERNGEIGGGGALLAYAINLENGKLRRLNEKASLSCNPSYLYLDKTGGYLAACHCADPWHVTKIVQRPDGSFSNEVLFDDTSLVLFRVQPDGRLGEICDLDITPGSGGKDEHSERRVDPYSGHVQLVRVLSRLHSIVSSPSGEMLAVCDKGMDRIYTYRLDRITGKLKRLSCWNAPEVACFPRYSAFHPFLNAFYANNESQPTLNTFRYDEVTGELTRIARTELLEDDFVLPEGERIVAQDVLVHPNGKVLYCSLGGVDQIVVCALDQEGLPQVLQCIPCRGKLPRSITLSPDGRFLLCGNMVSGDITLFAADRDGRLTDTGRTVQAVSPSAIRFYTPEEQESEQ